MFNNYTGKNRNPVHRKATVATQGLSSPLYNPSTGPALLFSGTPGVYPGYNPPTILHGQYIVVE
jgi:hypothetical protein